jgi:peptidyl-dipeptidase Dcp
MKFKKTILMTALSLAICGCSTQQPKEQGNPFFSEFNTPYGIAPFADITIEHYREGMLKGMEEQKAEIEAITNNSEAPTFENTIVALDQCGQLLRHQSIIDIVIHKRSSLYIVISLIIRNPP